MLTTKKTSGCLILFATSFAAVGVLMAVLIGRQLYSWIDMQSWEATPAKIIETKLEESSGDDSITYKVTARYEYSFNGTNYISDRVSLSEGSDNIGSFHEDTYRLFDKHRLSGEPITCYVNPLDPSNAIIIRDLRLEMILFMTGFGLVFGGIGFGLLLMLYIGSRALKKTDAAAAIDANNPRLSSGHTIPSDAGSFAAIALIIAIITTGFMLPLLIVILIEIVNEENYLAAIGLVFPLLGFFVVRWAISRALSGQRFKGTVLELAKHPVRVGERMSGSIRVPTLLPQCEVQLKLVCTKLEKINSSDGNSVQISEALKLENTVHARQGGMQTSVIDVSFEIPETAPLSTSEGNPTYMWKLEAKADIPGADFVASFNITVSK